LIDFIKLNINNTFSSIRNHTSFVKFFSSNILSVPVSLITGFISFRNIDPIHMGIWSTVTIFEVYTNFLRMGIVNGMNRELPFAMGQKDNKKAEKFASSTLLFSLFNIIILLLITPLVLKQINLDERYYACLAVVLFKACLSFYTTYLTGTFRSDNQFDKLSNINLISLGAKLLFCPLVLLGFNGFLIYEVILLFVGAILLHKFRPIKISPKLYWPEFKSLFYTGIPMFVTSYIVNVIDTLPRLFIVKYGTEQLLGLYSPVLMLLNTLMIFPSTISTYLYPKFSFKIGMKIAASVIWKQYFKVIILSFLAISGMVFIGYFLIDYFGVIFPKYALSVPYLKAALLICPFLVYKLGNTINVVLRKPQFMLSYAIFYGVFQLFSYFIILSPLNDILLKVIYSQVITAFATLIFGLLVNYYIVIQYDKKNSMNSILS
jgi:O-antigen/teichoic acid export membrane protein